MLWNSPSPVLPGRTVISCWTQCEIFSSDKSDVWQLKSRIWYQINSSHTFSMSSSNIHSKQILVLLTLTQHTKQYLFCVVMTVYMCSCWSWQWTSASPYLGRPWGWSRPWWPTFPTPWRMVEIVWWCGQNIWKMILLDSPPPLPTPPQPSYIWEISCFVLTKSMTFIVENCKTCL